MLVTAFEDPEVRYHQAGEVDQDATSHQRRAKKGTMTQNPATQYATDANLAKRQRLWTESRRDPHFDLFPWVLDLAGVHDGDARTVLDIGCGNGVYERLLRDRGHVGVRVAADLSEGMLALVTDAARVNADVQSLPMADQAFDVVLAPHMLYHVPDRVSAAREMRRVMRADGIGVVVTNGERNFAEFKHLMEQAVGTDWTMWRPVDQYFSLESGTEQLRTAFDTVTRVDCPASDVVVTDLDAFTDYVDSIGDHYEAEVGVPWAGVVRRARSLAAEAMELTGEFRLTTSVGAFVCR